MLVVYANGGKWRFSSSLALLTAHIWSIQYIIMPHNLVFAGIYLLLPSCACITSGYTKQMLKFFFGKLKSTSTAISRCPSFPFLPT